jgi:hypothetical protein
MSSTLVRLMLSVVFMFSLPVLYTLVFIVGEELDNVDDETLLWITTVIVGVYMVFGWIIIWMRQVHWTPWRIALTAAAVPATVGPAVLAGWGLVLVIEWFDEFAILLGGMVWGILYLAATLVVWRETATERARRLHQLGLGQIGCPRCGYNLTGLREASCPECGSRYTLDELFAAAATRQKDLGL